MSISMADESGDARAFIRDTSVKAWAALGSKPEHEGRTDLVDVLISELENAKRMANQNADAATRNADTYAKNELVYIVAIRDAHEALTKAGIDSMMNLVDRVRVLVRQRDAALAGHDAAHKALDEAGIDRTGPLPIAERVARLANRRSPRPDA